MGLFCPVGSLGVLPDGRGDSKDGERALQLLNILSHATSAHSSLVTEVVIWPHLPVIRLGINIESVSVFCEKQTAENLLDGLGSR